MSVMTRQGVMRRPYDYCAKCGAPKDHDAGWVGACHINTPGLYTHCAVGGEPIPDAPTRCYVCESHLARNMT